MSFVAITPIAGMIGYLWRIHAENLDFSHKIQDIVEFGFYMRSEQGHGLGSAQNAYICSIVLNISNALTIRLVDWNAILSKALEFPMLDTIELFVQTWDDDELEDFAHRHRDTLAIADSQGKLRLRVAIGSGNHEFEHAYSSLCNLSDVIDLTNTDELPEVRSIPSTGTPIELTLEPLFLSSTHGMI